MLLIPSIRERVHTEANPKHTKINKSELTIKLPIIIGRQRQISKRRYVSEESVNQNESILKNKFINSRWKLNRPFIEGYSSNDKSQIEKENQEISPKKIQRENINDSKINIFFTGISLSEKQKINANRQEMNSAVNKSKQLIKLIKNNRKQLIKLKVSHQQRDISDAQNSKQTSNQIYSYLNREFIVKKEQILDDRVLEQYIANSPTKKVQQISEKGRKFLLQKMHNDYHNYNDVHYFKRRQIKEQFQKQVKQKKNQFQKDYSSRYSIPYFNFLSLSSSERSNILQRRECQSMKYFKT